MYKIHDQIFCFLKFFTFDVLFNGFSIRGATVKSTKTSPNWGFVPNDTKRCAFFEATKYQKPKRKYQKNRNFQKTIFWAINFVPKIMLTKYEVLTRIQLRYLLVQTLRFTSADSISVNVWLWTPLGAPLAESCLGSGDFPEISGILPTLRSCISELKKYFLMGPVPLQRSMSKL